MNENEIFVIIVILIYTLKEQDYNRSKVQLKQILFQKASVYIMILGDNHPTIFIS